MEPHPQTAPKATVSPRKSPYFAPSSRTKNLPRKRKASAKPLQDAKKVDEFQERSQSLKRRKDDNGPAECNTLEVEGVIEPHNQKAVPDPGESPSPVGHFDIELNDGKEDKQDVNESKAPSETIKHTEEYVKAARKAARKDLRARERAERATRSSSSPKKDSIAKLSRHMAGTESHDHSQQVSQYSPHEHGQTSNTMGTMKSQGPDLYRSQLPASIASEGPVTKATKRGPRTRAPKARSREVAAKKETDPAKAAEPIEIAEGKSVSRKRKIDEDAELLEGGQKTPIATITPINPGKKEQKGPTSSSAEQSSKAEGFQSPMIR